MELIVKKFVDEQEAQFTKAFEHITGTFKPTKRSINLTLSPTENSWVLPHAVILLLFWLYSDQKLSVERGRQTLHKNHSNSWKESELNWNEWFSITQQMYESVPLSSYMKLTWPFSTVWAPWTSTHCTDSLDIQLLLTYRLESLIKFLLKKSIACTEHIFTSLYSFWASVGHCKSRKW